jgi:hypothetical protein
VTQWRGGFAAAPHIQNAAIIRNITMPKKNHAAFQTLVDETLERAHATHEWRIQNFHDGDPITEMELAKTMSRICAQGRRLLKLVRATK